MKLILASFGLGTADDWQGGGPHYTESASEFESPYGGYFLRMPAVAMNRFGPKFVPDYPVFLLFDDFLIDHQCYQRIQNEPAFAELKSLIAVLESTGRLEIASFEEIIDPYKSMIDQSAEYDLRNLEMWADAFQKLFDRWQDFRTLVMMNLEGIHGEPSQDQFELRRAVEHSAFGMLYTPDGLQIMESIKNWKRSIPKEQRQRTRLVVRDYLRYVSSNLCLSQCTGGVLHEWGDIEPLCLQKLRLSASPDDGKQASQESVRQLFELVIPDFEPRDPTRFAQALDDPRVESLRSIVNDAVAKNKAFDQEFLNATLREVLASRERASFYRKLVGWMSTPLSLIPWAGSAAQKAVEEAAGYAIDRSFKKKHEWFFLVSDFAKR